MNIFNRNGYLMSVVNLLSLKNLLPDKYYLAMKYKRDYGKNLDWTAPDTFQAKLQWLKINYRTPLLTDLVDKYKVKEYVKEKIGAEYLIPTIAVWDNVEDIQWHSLPSKFVIKCTHDSGGLIVCRNKSELNIEEAKAKLNRCMKNDFYYLMREWPYKNVIRRIIVEPLIEEKGYLDLSDYKFYCFNGKPLYCQLIGSRSTIETIDFFDREWRHQDFIGLNPVCANAPVCAKKPDNYAKMLELAECLASNFPFVRVDFYNVGGKIYFGEMTFFPAGGFGTFIPKEWNFRLGKLINLEC